MKNFNFKYKSQNIGIRRKINSSLSILLFSLYRNNIFQKLKLNKNPMIRYTVEERDKKDRFPFKTVLPKNPLIEPYSVTLYDLIDFDELMSNSKKFIRLLSKYKGGFLSKDPEKEVKKAFEKLKDSYKTISYGNICYNDLKNDFKSDLIDGISYGYVKGQQAYMLLTYTIFPSQKFKDSFKKALNEPIRDEHEIRFNSFGNILKGKKWITSLNHKPIYPIHYVNKLYNEINFQFKSNIVSDFKFGVFNSNKKTLFPIAITYEYDKEETTSYFKEILDRMRIMDWNLFSDDSIKFHFPDKYSSGIELFIPKTTDFEKQKSPFSTASYLSDNYLNAISTFWTLLNITDLYKTSYVKIRKKMFSYLSKNEDSIFLTNAIKLKRELNLIFWQLERICKDFSSSIYDSQLNFRGIPDLKNTPRISNAQANEFKKELINSTKHATNELLSSFNEINDTFERISNDNLVKSNMRLQRILFAIAILGVLLTIYGTNADSFNDLFLNMIKKLFCN